MVGTGDNYEKKNCESKNYSSCVTIKTKQVVDNTSSTSIEKKCGFSMEIGNSIGNSSNNDTLNDEDIQTLYGGIGKDEFFKLENDCSYLNETNTNVCRCMSNLCNTGYSVRNIHNIIFILVILTITVVLAV